LALAGTLFVTSVAPASAAPSDAVRSSQQWVLNMLDVPAAWGISQGAGVTVAVVDSGVNSSVSDLAGSVTTGPDLTGLNTSSSDSNWGVHGTWMASIIAGHGHDGGGSGIIGIAPRAKLLSIRVIPDKDDPGYNTYDAEQDQQIQQSLANGIRDAAKDGAKVISMSIGYSAPSRAVRAALQYAESRGVVLVASSGNSGQDLSLRSHGFAPVSFPADYPGVLSVAAVAADGAVAGFSSDNLSVQVAAPGVNVPAEGRDGQYWLVSGTSPACALVAGAAALIKSRYPGLAPSLVDQALTSTARNGSGVYDAKNGGFGTVDVAKALHEAGVLAAQRPGKSPEAASGQFGGGSAGVPAAPVQPRGAGHLFLFSLLGLAGAVLAIGAGLWLRRRGRKASPGMMPYGYPAGPPVPPAAQPNPSPAAPSAAPSVRPYSAPPAPAGPPYAEPPTRPASPQYPGQPPASGQYRQYQEPERYQGPEQYREPEQYRGPEQYQQYQRRQ
jgi:subtilisin family serine protease